jgi:putative toxin-antitoxin system antitoxin component (TIGR02293 family)
VSAALALLDPSMRSLSSLALAEQVERGLPISALDRLTEAMAPGGSGFANKLVPRATLARRRSRPDARLTNEESARILRVGEIWEFALKVWQDADKARHWLFRPHMMLDDRSPIDVVIASEYGKPVVEGILGRLYYGTGV